MTSRRPGKPTPSRCSNRGGYSFPCKRRSDATHIILCANADATDDGLLKGAADLSGRFERWPVVLYADASLSEAEVVRHLLWLASKLEDPRRGWVACDSTGINDA